MLNALSTTRRKAAAAVTTAALLAGGGAAAIAANSATASAATKSPASHVAKAHKAKAKAKAKDRKGLLARTDHATFEVKLHGKWVTLLLDRGVVTSVSSTAVTLHLPDGNSATETVSATTKFGKDKTWREIKAGHDATVVSDNGVALHVLQSQKAKDHKPKGLGALPST
jgi:hypothetical protein